MRFLGTYQQRRVYWWDYSAFQLEQLPTDNWIVVDGADRAIYDDPYEAFVRHAMGHAS